MSFLTQLIIADFRFYGILFECYCADHFGIDQRSLHTNSSGRGCLFQGLFTTRSSCCYWKVFNVVWSISESLDFEGITIFFNIFHKALGLKGMYNGDSFGYLMDARVTSGPYKYFTDPQYVGLFHTMGFYF